MSQQHQSPKIQRYSNVQPIWKFIFLYVISFGLYIIPWGHKHWKFFKEREGLQGSAWLRSLFLGLTLYWLVKRVVALAERRGYPEKPSPILTVFLFYLIASLSRSSDPTLGLVSMLSFLPLLTVVKASNFYWEKEQSNLPRREFWTAGEIAWTVLGGIFWLLVLIGLFAPVETLTSM